MIKRRRETGDNRWVRWVSPFLAMRYLGEKNGTLTRERENKNESENESKQNKEGNEKIVMNREIRVTLNSFRYFGQKKMKVRMRKIN